jgi:hypothetical protein
MHHQGPFNAAATFCFVIDEIKMICAVYLVSCTAGRRYGNTP